MNTCAYSSANCERRSNWILRSRATFSPNRGSGIGSIRANEVGQIGLIGILVAFGHWFLAMSGEESLAQINRELEYPKHQNLRRAGFIIFLYSLLFTSQSRRRDEIFIEVIAANELSQPIHGRHRRCRSELWDLDLVRSAVF